LSLGSFLIPFFFFFFFFLQWFLSVFPVVITGSISSLATQDPRSAGNISIVMHPYFSIPWALYFSLSASHSTHSPPGCVPALYISCSISFMCLCEFDFSDEVAPYSARAFRMSAFLISMTYGTLLQSLFRAFAGCSLVNT